MDSVGESPQRVLYPGNNISSFSLSTVSLGSHIGWLGTLRAAPWTIALSCLVTQNQIEAPEHARRLDDCPRTVDDLKLRNTVQVSMVSSAYYLRLQAHGITLF